MPVAERGGGGRMRAVLAIVIVLLAAACAYGVPLDSSSEPRTLPVDAAGPWPSVAGADRVAARGCAACHQSPNLADGVLSGQIAKVGGAYGSNLTPDPWTGLGAWSDESVVIAMRFGLDARGAPLCEAMPRYADMADEEARAIVDYLRSLPPIRRAVPAGACASEDADGGFPARAMDDASEASDRTDAADAADAALDTTDAGSRCSQ